MDIYILSINLAFKLNGPTHYEPIYGTDRLENTKNKDRMKMQLCHQKNIELCVIDTSHRMNWRNEKIPPMAFKYLEYITTLIESKSLIKHGNVDR